MSGEVNKFSLPTVELERIGTSKGVYTLAKKLNSIYTTTIAARMISA